MKLAGVMIAGLCALGALALGMLGLANAAGGLGGALVLCGLLLGVLAFVGWRAPGWGGAILLLIGLLGGFIFGAIGAAFSEGVSTRDVVLFAPLFGSPLIVPALLMLGASFREGRSRRTVAVWGATAGAESPGRGYVSRCIELVADAARDLSAGNARGGIEKLWEAAVEASEGQDTLGLEAVFDCAAPLLGQTKGETRKDAERLVVFVRDRLRQL